MAGNAMNPLAVSAAAGVSPAVQAVGGAAGKTKAVDFSDVATMFASMMNSSYQNMSQTASGSSDYSVNGLGASGRSADSYQYTYRDTSSAISQAQPADVAQKVTQNADTVKDVGQEIVKDVAESLGVDEEEVADAMETLGLTAFDLLDSQNLAQLTMTITGSEEPSDLLVNPDFVDLMQDVAQIGQDLMQGLELPMSQMDEAISQMDVLAQPEELDASLLAKPEASAAAQEEIPAQAAPEAENIVEVEISPDVSVQAQPEALQTAQTAVQEPEMPQAAETKAVTAEEPQASVSEPVQAEETKPIAENSQAQTSDESQQDQAQANDQQVTAQADSQKPTVKTAAQPTGEQGINAQLSENEISQPSVSAAPEVEPYVSYDALDIIQQIAENVKVAISADSSSIEMQLNPEELGKVLVQVTAKEGAVSAQLTVTNATVREALISQMATLSENLNQAGVKVDAIEVTVEAHEFERNLEQGQGEQERPQEEQQGQQSHGRRNINLSDLDELTGVMTEEEALVAQIMKDNGNSVDLSA
ncbi:MAG: flagellar hook-length control protein FliK [Clostridiales bacterium]|nr:flagellar hook-length control protein FliK [Clostridiales bacterium]